MKNIGRSDYKKLEDVVPVWVFKNTKIVTDPPQKSAMNSFFGTSPTPVRRFVHDFSVWSIAEVNIEKEQIRFVKRGPQGVWTTYRFIDFERHLRAGVIYPAIYTQERLNYADL